MNKILYYLKTLPLRIWYLFWSAEIVTTDSGRLFTDGIIYVGDSYFMIQECVRKNGLCKIKIKKIVKPYEVEK